MGLKFQKILRCALQYNQNVEKRYYRIGRRPLDNELLKKGYKAFESSQNVNLEHRQFVSEDGKNFGLSKGVNSKYNNIVEEDAEKIKSYSYDIQKFQNKKYDADCIDAAREQLEKEWRSRIDNVDVVPPFSGFPEKIVDFLPYDVVGYNCQDFVDDVIRRAEKIAKERGVPLVIYDEDSSKGLPEQPEEIFAGDWGKILYPNMN